MKFPVPLVMHQNELFPVRSAGVKPGFLPEMRQNVCAREQHRKKADEQLSLFATLQLRHAKKQNILASRQGQGLRRQETLFAFESMKHLGLANGDARQ